MANPAKATIIINRIANDVVTPVTGPTSRRAITAKDWPLCRIDANKIIKSCTAPANTDPIKIQIKPGPHPYCAAKTGPTNGPAPAIAAK